MVHFRTPYLLYCISISFFVFIVLTVSLFPSKAHAAITCRLIYGGGQTCMQVADLLINKTVINPATNQPVDYLGINDAKYTPGSIVTFKITVKSNAESRLSNIEVKDTLPQYVYFAKGDGAFDARSQTVTIKANTLNPNESKTFTVRGKVASASALPKDKNIVCVVNQATATAKDLGIFKDNAQFCIEKTTIKLIPPTGPEMLPLFALFPMGIAGLMLRKVSKHVHNYN
ncbi:MAG: hypothetical protein A3J69_02220 [Candidatus Levybacteria bacterium RIFCSPHIGHO2_02_FULL_42_12]|nr:MAG: hypothetical protein A2698_00055 [Candidatus Levybacteria bacterium RIFCSPHIGHO2_01_FULL_42_15]OGH30808.1 MAG: hypothetical protein A3J69_02220 [Candidatus Levybacteria bacterium RIFCSPHIGHO2_02_FULL_42_12]OGH42731.1 MAG: hypothetical protein A3B53_00060 [Candidatus Levybacteria bacterium RIFCSPLOWO2_01_FULL_42_15]